MFTVILLSDRALHRFERWRLLFEPYERAGVLRVCEWHRGENAEDLPRVAPGLADAILGEKEWRTIVVDLLGENGADSDESTDDNPFDFRDNFKRGPAGGSREHLNLEPSRHPVIRLAHLLLGYPDMGAKTFVSDPSYWDPEEDKRVYLSDITREVPDDSEEFRSVVADFNASLVAKHDVKIHFRSVPYTAEEVESHRDLSERYRPIHSRPKEVLFLATSTPKRTNPIESVRKAWSPREAFSPSRFVERNDYPPSCRFLVHEIPQVNDNQFEIENLRLWLGLLSIAINDLPASTVQAERLYRMEVDWDEKELAEMINDQLTQLAAEREFVEASIRRPRQTTDSTVEDILRQEPVRVSFEDLGGAELAVPAEGYSWASDVPRSEALRWHEAVTELQVAAERFSRRPRRELSRTVMQIREMAQKFRTDDIALDKLSIDELEEELSKRSQRLAHPTTRDILDRASLKQRIDDHDKRMARAIAQRMDRRTIRSASAVVTMAWILAFAPYLTIAVWNVVAFLESLIVVIITMTLLGALGVLILVAMKRRLLRRLRHVNDDLRRYVSSVNGAATEFASYLTALLAYMKGQSVLISSRRGHVRDMQRKEQLEKIQVQIVEHMERGKSIIRALGQELNIEKGASSRLRTHGITNSQFAQIFQWPVGMRQAQLNKSGEAIEAPYDFIKRLSIVNLEVTEPPHD